MFKGIPSDQQTPGQTVFRIKTRNRVRYRVKKLFMHLYKQNFHIGNLAEKLYSACANDDKEEALNCLYEFDQALFKKPSRVDGEHAPAVKYLSELQNRDVEELNLPKPSQGKLTEEQKKKLSELSMIQVAIDEIVKYMRELYPRRFYAARKQLCSSKGPKVGAYEYQNILMTYLFEEARVAVILGWPDDDVSENFVKRTQSVVKAHEQLRGQRMISAEDPVQTVLEKVADHLCKHAPSTLKDCKEHKDELVFVRKALDAYFGRLQIPWSRASKIEKNIDLVQLSLDADIELLMMERVVAFAKLLLADWHELSRPLKAFLTKTEIDRERPGPKGAPIRFTDDEVEKGAAEFWQRFCDASSTSSNVTKLGDRNARKRH